MIKKFAFALSIIGSWSYDVLFAFMVVPPILLSKSFSCQCFTGNPVVMIHTSLRITTIVFCRIIFRIDTIHDA